LFESREKNINFVDAADNVSGTMFGKDKEKSGGDSSHSPEPDNVEEGMLATNVDDLQRHLNNRQIQLIAIGGSIGTALFVSIGGGLYKGGAANLLLAYTIQSCVLALVNNSIAEMSTAYPVTGGFIRLAGHFCDDALGFMVGWNFLYKPCSAVQQPSLTIE
jgi:yeast amino acid transporter